MPPTVFQPSGYTYGYSPFGAAPRNVGVSSSGFGMEQYGGFATPTDYQNLPARFPSPHGSTPSHDVNDFGGNQNGIHTPNEAWINNFQGLSMNTR